MRYSQKRLAQVTLAICFVLVLAFWPSQPNYPILHSQYQDILVADDKPGRGLKAHIDLRNRTLPRTVHCQFYEWRSVGLTQEDRMNCVNTKTDPVIPVCLYDRWKDVFISRDLETTGIWEPHVMNDLQEVLKRDPTLGFIDAGANIGFYSLLAAQMGHAVVAIEPYSENIKRFDKAVEIAGLENDIILLANAISSVRTEATLYAQGDNKGDIRVRLEAPPCVGSCPPIIKTILLDDLVEVITFKQAVLKIDIQGYEHSVFLKSNKLFNNVFIPFIFMEWLVMRDHFVASNHTSADKAIVEMMINGLMSRDFRPYALDAHGGAALNPAHWHQWPTDIVWRRQLTEDEKEKVLSNHFLAWPN